ncbi:hypothetical protein HQ545_03360 [Candidatus Woesearchaeota archaeon]|nr:hypothetical protein [Candidatus Woesearchaeota archaeon]
MEINIHFFTSIALAIVLYPFLGWLSVFAIAGGFLVDFDHYLLYVVKKHDLSLKRAIGYYRQRRYMTTIPVLHIFHTVEAFIVILALAYMSDIFKAVLLGYLLHMILDLTHCIRCNGWGHRTNSIIWWLVRRSIR